MPKTKVHTLQTTLQSSLTATSTRAIKQIHLDGFQSDIYNLLYSIHSLKLYHGAKQLLYGAK